MGRSDKTVSIQQQYITIAVLLGSIIVIVSSAVYIDAITRSNLYVEQVEKTTDLLRKSHNIRSHYQNVKDSLGAFMLQPELDLHRTQINADMLQALNHIEDLKNDPLVRDLASYVLLDEITNVTRRFESRAQKLFEVRTSANDQYPALAVATLSMRPQRNEIFSILGLAIDEFFDDDELKANADVFDLLIETRRLWITLIAEFRLYLANRIGSFAEQGLIDQAVNIEGYLDQLSQHVVALQQYAEQSRLGFEGNALVQNLPDHLAAWRRGFDQVRKIHQSSGWRQDTQLMREDILPLLNIINQHLSEIEMDLGALNSEFIDQLNRSGNNLSLVLAGVILLFLFYIGVTIVSLKRFIVRPIASIAHALKNEAFGKTSLHTINIRKSRETQDLIEAFNEMSHQVYQRQKELEHQALNDSLTSLPNRLMLQERLQYHIKIAQRQNLKLVLMILDLNLFKEVNDTLGHHVGDQLLIKVGNRLQCVIRGMDTVARLGGDEFAILLPQADREHIRQLADRINTVISKPFNVHNHSLNISASIGIAEYPTDSEDIHTLMQYADVAMYESKRNKTGYSFYDASADIHSVERLSLVSDLRSALQNDELELYYQPKFNLSDGSIVGSEALLRWDHPVRGAVAPELIIDTAEKMGLINEVSYWIIDKAIAECARCTGDGHPFNVAINLSVQNLRDDNLNSKVLEIIEHHQVSPARITFEITESAMMTNPEQSIEMLNLLSLIGVRLSVDDYGTGFSSLAYLKQLPVDELKIDKSFVIEMDTDESDQMIVNSTIQLAHNLGLTVVAEGVENARSWDLLLQMDCDFAQGYYMDKPLRARDFRKILHKLKDGYVDEKLRTAG